MGANDPALTADPTRRGTVGAPRVKREHLSFRPGGEEYFIDVLKAQEIRGGDGATRIVNAPAHIPGVINRRPVIVPIVDLRVTFALGEAGYDAVTVVIVRDVAQRVVGAAVDPVSDVLAPAPEQIRAAPAFNALPDASHVTGLATARRSEAERRLILIDIGRLMAGPDLGLAEPQRH